MINNSLDKLYIVKDGTHDSPTYVSREEGYPLVTSKNLRSGELDFVNVNYISQKDFDKINERSKVDKGDLLFAMIGTIGNPITVKIDPFFAIKNVALFKPNEENNSLEYLRLLLQSELIKRKLLKNSKGGTQKFISLGNLRRLQIPIPETKKEQLQIVSVLSKCENLINQRKESIELADEFLKHTFLTMFENGDFETDTLENLVHVDCPLTYGIVQPGEEVNSGVPVVRPVDQTNEYIGLEGLKLIDPAISEKFSRTILKGGEILLCVRGTTGLLSIATEELKGVNVTRGITPIWFSEEFNTLFAYYLLKSERVQRVIQEKTYGATLQQINLRDVRLIELIKPPIELQDKFSKIAKGVYELKKYFQQSLNELEELYKSLSYKAFNGELAIIEKIEIEGSIKIQPKISGKIEVIETKESEDDGYRSYTNDRTEPWHFGIDEIDEIDSKIKDESYSETKEVAPSITHIPFLKTEEDLLNHISRNCSGSHFTFEDIKGAVKGLDWTYDFEELKNLVFSLVRKKQLKQIFADASYKSGFDKTDPDFREVSSLSEQIYFKRVL